MEAVKRSAYDGTRGALRPIPPVKSAPACLSAPITGGPAAAAVNAPEDHHLKTGACACRLGAPSPPATSDEQPGGSQPYGLQRQPARAPTPGTIGRRETPVADGHRAPATRSTQRRADTEQQPTMSLRAEHSEPIRGEQTTAPLPGRRAMVGTAPLCRAGGSADGKSPRAA